MSSTCVSVSRSDQQAHFNERKCSKGKEEGRLAVSDIRALFKDLGKAGLPRQAHSRRHRGAAIKQLEGFLRIARQTHSVVLVGQTANDIAASIPTRGTRPRVHRAATLEDAVRHALDTAVPGDRVVLSPACASYDMFVNYMERGSRFKELIRDGAPHNNS